MSITLVSCVRIEFEEWILSLLREPGKHDCIVGETMEEFNPSELGGKQSFITDGVQAWLRTCLLLF
jgi:hypothetical protein